MPRWRSGRRMDWLSRARASPVSEAMLRSWNSSKSTQDTPERLCSSVIMRVKTPSVTTKSRVDRLTRVSWRMAMPTRPPTVPPVRFARWRANMRAAARRGSRSRTRPGRASSAQRGTRVLLPVPGGASSRKTGLSRRSSEMRGRYGSMGSGGSVGMGRPVDLVFWRVSVY